MTLRRSRVTRLVVLSALKAASWASCTARNFSRSPSLTAAVSSRYGRSALCAAAPPETAVVRSFFSGISPSKSLTTVIHLVSSRANPLASLGALRCAWVRHSLASEYSSWIARMRPR